MIRCIIYWYLQNLEEMFLEPYYDWTGISVIQDYLASQQNNPQYQPPYIPGSSLSPEKKLSSLTSCKSLVDGPMDVGV